ncbi:hypothetical protein [Streptomyces cadmiisoli]|uniref:hypothetical protein n=1 Tax=Streptomyces cadmiisoli TaxID=2184053 RepID=UPI00364BBA99
MLGGDGFGVVALFVGVGDVRGVGHGQQVGASGKSAAHGRAIGVRGVSVIQASVGDQAAGLFFRSAASTPATSTARRPAFS